MFKDNKRLVVDTLFIKEVLKKDVSLNEFLLLMYFDNAFDSSFDPAAIGKVIGMSEEKILEAYASLISKGIISISTGKDASGKVNEKISLDNMYNEMNMDTKRLAKEKSKNDIFSIFESEFGRTLSTMDYEIINAWIEKGFEESLIIAALKEAVYNGANNLRYIDKVLFEWNRKGIKTPDDIAKKLTSEENATILETSVLNFDWLNDKE